jgi:hypothetical protein
MAYVVDPLHPDDPGFRGPVPAWAQNLKNKATNNPSIDDEDMAKKGVAMPSNPTQLSPDQIQEAYSNRTDGARDLTPDEIAEAHANALPQTSDNSSSPSLIEHPEGWLAAHNYLFPTGQNIENLTKDFVTSLGTDAQNVAQFLGKGLQSNASSPGPLTSFQNAAGYNPQSTFNSIKNAISPYSDPALNYDIPYHLNTPRDTANRVAQGLFGAIPLSLIPGAGSCSKLLNWRSWNRCIKQPSNGWRCC